MKTNPDADPLNEKHQAYDAAVALLAESGDDSLRYAALEPRRCIEAIVYEKLKVYGNLLPEGSVHQWQPPQAFDALLTIEPGAEATFTYAIGPQTEPGKISAGPFHTVGVDERPKAKWIKKTWQKLGFYLHAEWPFALHKPKSSLRAFLEKTLADVAPLVSNNFSAMLSMKIDFECASCGTTVKVMEKAVEKTGQAICLTCGMPYRAEKSDGNFTFFPARPPLHVRVWRVDLRLPSTRQNGIQIFMPELQPTVPDRRRGVEICRLSGTFRIAGGRGGVSGQRQAADTNDLVRQRNSGAQEASFMHTLSNQERQARLAFHDGSRVDVLLPHRTLACRGTEQG